jgi:hypothetical protein
MKHLQTVPAGRAAEYEATIMHPERTAKKNSGDWDIHYAEWPNRPSMAKTIRMQQSGENFAKAWRAVQPLKTTEGF